MSRYPANIITKSPATPTGPTTAGRAPGVWRMDDVAYWVKQGVWPNANIQAPDTYFPYVSLLLSTTALGNANNNLFVDSSGAFNPISRGSTTTQGSFTPYGADWSNYFDGSGDYLTVSPTALSTGDFTFECWIYSTGTGQYQYFYDTRASTNDAAGFCVIYNHASYPNKVSIYSNGFIGTPTINVSVNTWTHFALVRSSGSWTTYINGAQDISPTSVSRTLSNTALKVGAGQALDYFFNGNLSNYRIVNGTAVYTAAFTPPTSPLTAISGTSLLTCQSNRFRDASTNNFTITANGDTKVQSFSPFAPAYPGITYNQSDIQYWSGYFDGTGDYLAYPYSTGLQFPGDFTVECWVFPIARVTSFPCIVNNYSTYTTNGGFAIFAGHGSANTAKYNVSFNGSFPVIQSTDSIVYNAWAHIALVRSGSTITLYVNGVANGTATSSATVTGTANSWWVGTAGDSIGAGEFNGYISNLRAVKGTAVYTGAFTPPTSPLTAISGTGLLTCQNAAFTDNSTNNATVTIAGNTTVTGSNPFQAGYYSGYFDGSGDYLSVANNAAFQLGTGDFTVEFWINAAASGSYTQTIGTLLTGTEAGTWRIGNRFNSGNEVYFARGNGGGFDEFRASVNVNDGAWHHVAVARASGTARIFIDGVLGASSTVSGTCTSSNDLRIGYNQRDSAYVTGYLSNVRIVKGTALYTAAFTPPTSPLTAVSGTSFLACQSARFIDTSSNALSITVNGDTKIQSFDPFYTSTTASNGGSMYFSSTNTGALETILTVPATNVTDIGGGDFTLECWVYATSVQNYSRIVNFNNTWASAGATNLLFDTGTQKITFACYDFGGTVVNANDTYKLNTWYHVAVTRASNVFSMYINGVKQTATYTTSSRMWATATPTVYIGNGPTSVGGYSPMQGYVSDVRIIKGSAIYTATFTPPSAPLTPTPATVLLANGMNAGAYDATAINDMETFGSAQVSTVQSKFGGSSIYIPTGCLFIPNSQPLVLGSGNWTVEFWAYTDASGTKVYFDSLNAANTVLQMEIYSSGTSISWVTVGSGVPNITGTGALTANTWQHIAACKSGSSTRLFVNGTQVGSTYTDTATYDTARWEIGSRLSGSFPIVGYLDDLRITKGVARYTANFTAPTQAFTPY